MKWAVKGSTFFILFYGFLPLFCFFFSFLRICIVNTVLACARHTIKSFFLFPSFSTFNIHWLLLYCNQFFYRHPESGNIFFWINVCVDECRTLMSLLFFFVQANVAMAFSVCVIIFFLYLCVSSCHSNSTWMQWEMGSPR